MSFASSAMALPCHSGVQQTCERVSASLKTLIPTGIKAPALNSLVNFARVSRLGSRRRRDTVTCYVRPLRPVEERFRILVERNVGEERLEELNVKRWSKWESDACGYDYEWKVDEQVYIVKGSLQVTPADCQDSAVFYAGDLVRFPKWLNAMLSFDGEYEQRYRFLAYGDD